MNNPDPMFVWNLILTVGVLSGIAVNLLTLAKTNKTQKREVTFGEQYVERDVFIDRMNKVEASAEVARRDASDSRAKLYDHIDETRRELSDKIDGMPAQIIVMLKNTGAIK